MSQLRAVSAAAPIGGEGPGNSRRDGIPACAGMTTLGHTFSYFLVVTVILVAAPARGGRASVIKTLFDICVFHKDQQSNHRVLGLRPGG
jgi:hypothetical protein